MNISKRKKSEECISEDVEEHDNPFIIPSNTEMGQLCRTIDWSKTAFGPTSTWPQSLRTAASMCLTNRFPTLIMWGPEATQIYNDGYIQVLGARHPSLGRSAKEVWYDIWDSIGPLIKKVTETGESVYLDDTLFFVHSPEGYLYERYFTFSESPIYVGQSVGGILNTVSETTAKIFNERQLKSLGNIASHTTEATVIRDACAILAKTIAMNPIDIPFASIYLFDNRGLVLIETVYVDKDSEMAPIEVRENRVYTCPNQEKFAEVLMRVATTDTEELIQLQGYNVPRSPAWDKQDFFPRECKVFPIESSTLGVSLGVIALGISPTRPLDDGYNSYLKLVAAQTAAVIGNARSHEEERKKAEMLAELDRAKTTFFSNISHEFRTPITLMLGPIEDLITKERSLPETSLLDQLELIHRNALRLLKLVNALLDFSRLEAGRMEATFQATNISQLTADLASVFRSACERVGLELIVDCPQISEMVYIDVDMYEKIILNLISNAYKYTLRGHIAVRIKELGKQAVQISVEDSGTGIPDEELPRLFERFHRVPDSKGRTHEGTGIGLAMVNELVKLHGGNIQTYSKLGQGSIFIVTIPFGKSHLPAERIKNESNQDNTKAGYIRTAEWWIGTETNKPPPIPESSPTPMDTSENKPRILICDDNADMREYLYNLLHEHYDLDIACDGVHALEYVARRLPELILSDIMMPKLDGYGLLHKLRQDTRTKTIPVIFLSARAGEESQVEGLSSGADDYLTKPFTARELLARIKTHLELSRIRQEAALRAENANKAKDHFLAVLSHELRTPLTPALLLVENLERDTSLPEKVRRDLETVTKNIKLEVKLIDDLLDVTKITKNKLVLSYKQVNAHKELEHTLSLVKHDAMDKNIQLEVDYQAEEFHIEADPTRLQQVFVNIVKNAIKFTPENGSIRIQTRNIDSELFAVDIKDTGIGINTEALPKIFESFQQGGAAITNRYGGLGLGLSISKALVQMMNGTISATSEGTGHGSVFTVVFPIIIPHNSPARDSPTRSPSEMLTPPQRILLTEDNKSTALVLTRFLKKLGHEVKTAYCVKEAKELAAANTFDLVISDVGLPDGTGFELMQTLKSIYGLHGICVTGYGMEEDIKMSKESGFDIHVVKPVEMQALQSAISFVVRQIQIKNSS